MEYKVEDFECPDETKRFLAGVEPHVETLVLQIFRAGWVRGNVYAPYICLSSYSEAVALGLLESVNWSGNKCKLTNKALEALHKVYGR